MDSDQVAPRLQLARFCTSDSDRWAWLETASSTTRRAVAHHPSSVAPFDPRATSLSFRATLCTRGRP
eukprot:2630590-Alexandrium_andersonii.AAC.1